MEHYNDIPIHGATRASNDSAARIEYPSKPKTYSRTLDVPRKAGLVHMMMPLWTSLDIAEAQDRALGLYTAPVSKTTTKSDTPASISPPPKSILKSATSSRRDSGVHGPPESPSFAPFTRESTVSSFVDEDEDESYVPVKRPRVSPSKRTQMGKRRPRATSRSSRKRDDLTIDGEGINPFHQSDRYEYRDAKGKWYEVPGLAAGEVPYWAVESRVVRIRNSTRS